MSIADSKSVLILGAGVSEPFGMPLGAQLVDGIADQIDSEAPGATSDDALGRKILDPHRVFDWAYPPKWHRYPIYGTLIRARLNENARLTQDKLFQAHDEIQALKHLLRNQTAETIDAFIAENPKTARTAKLALAAVMLRNMFAPIKEQPHTIAPRAFDARYLACTHRPDFLPKRERNWIHLLVNIIRHGIDEGSITPDNKISIVTFNYDTILEYVLDKQFRNREAPPEHYSNYVEILHVHGQFGDLVQNCVDPGLIATEWAQGICVVKEAPPEKIRTARMRAKELIAEARSVYAIGFSFAGPNCRLLGLGDSLTFGTRRLIYANYDGNRGIKESAERYTQSGWCDEKAGDQGRPLSVTDFIKAGFLGEPPG